MLAFKTFAIAKWWVIIHPTLRFVLEDLDRELEGPMVVTSIYRGKAEQAALNSPIGQRSVHRTKPTRGADIRIRNQQREVVRRAVSKVNSLWCYDASRPTLAVLVLESDHIHVQVHPNTEKIQ